MGYIRHHAIIVTSWDEKRITEARKEAKEICGNRVSSIVKSPLNGYYSFFVAPDGSKEGWEESEQGDYERRKFIGWIEAQSYDDGPNSLDYVEVFYGDEDGDSEIINNN